MKSVIDRIEDIEKRQSIKMNLKSNSINNNDNSNRNNINNYNNVNINQYNNNKYDREEKQLKDYLKNLLDAEKEIEQIKINLALKQDFNVEDVYRIFRCNNKDNCIKNEDLRNGLKLLDIFTSDTDIKNLMKRFDSNKKGYLNFSEFFDMIVPFEKEYRIMIENISSNNHIPPNCNPNVFLLSTKLILKNLFNTIIGLEDKFNNMKKRYDTLRNNLNDIFKILDQSSFGYFFFNDLQYYLHQNKILGNIKDVDLLFLRLDKNKDGKVDFCEFEDELKINF
jgi:Ca2+-binding EF-hand superfamily protein